MKVSADMDKKKKKKQIRQYIRGISIGNVVELRSVNLQFLA